MQLRYFRSPNKSLIPGERVAGRALLWFKTRLPTEMPMLRPLAALALSLVSATASMAQEVPQQAQMDMWCGTALVLMAGEAPADAGPENLAEAGSYAEGGQRLIDRAIPIFLESGYTDAALTSLRARLEADVDRAINGTGNAMEDADYSFQDCSALIGL